jgi:DNA (cytosine-5)-methyltransferase 1
MTFGSLFAGIGGLDLGFERAGLKCLYQVEKNEQCIEVLKRWWPGVYRYPEIQGFGLDVERRTGGNDLAM